MQRAGGRARAVVGREGGHRHLGGAEGEADGGRRGDDGAHAGRGQRAEQVALVVAGLRPPGARGRRRHEHDGAQEDERARDEQRHRGRGDDEDGRGEQRAGDEDELDGDAVQRVGGGQQARVVGQQAGQQRADDRAHRRDGDAGRQAARHQRARGRAREPEGDERAQRDGVQAGKRQHDPGVAVAVDEPAQGGSREADAEPEGGRDQRRRARTSPSRRARRGPSPRLSMPIGMRARTAAPSRRATSGARRTRA